MDLSGAAKYAPDTLQALVKHIDQQASPSDYNQDANLALLRLAQMEPASVSTQVGAKVLLRALTQLPRTDFRTCVLVMPERLLTDPVVEQLTALATALETTRFAEFWTLAAAHKDLISTVPGFEVAVRKYILHVFGITYQRVNKKVLGEALQLQGAALDTLLAAQVKEFNWKVSGDIVTMAKNEMNSPVMVTRTELIRFEQVAPVLRCMATAV